MFRKGWKYKKVVTFKYTLSSALHIKKLPNLQLNLYFSKAGNSRFRSLNYKMLPINIMDKSSPHC